jgi:GntR family transcriptional regulator, transcriptional repressor for pyruvate dehydrogenase complex
MIGDPPGLSLRPPRQQKLPEAVAQQLLAEIRARRLSPGTRLPSERELMDMLKVGRSTVREALHGLALLGVVEVRHGQGNFVASASAAVGTTQGLAAILSSGPTRDLLEARRLVEVQVARLAAERRSSEDLAEMEAILAEDATALEPAGVRPLPQRAFHLALCTAAHNQVLQGFVETYRSVLSARYPSLAAIPGYRYWEYGEHSRLLEAVRNQDVQLADHLMQAHLLQAEELYARVLRGEAPDFWPLPPEPESSTSEAEPEVQRG